MKTTNVIMASLAALLIAGCSQNEVMEVSPDANPQVGFNVYTGVSTKGVDMTTESMKDDPTDQNKYGGFGIMGYFTGDKKWEDAKTTTAPGFMHNQMVEWDATKTAWTYTPIKYWPNNPKDKISFFAYAPYEQSWQSGAKTGVTVCGPTTTGIPYINFEIKEGNDLPEMVDLVVAQKTDQQFTSNSATNGSVGFQFEHTLSRVSFKAKLGNGQFDGMDGDESFVFITEMWVVGSKHGTTKDEGNLSLLNPAAPSNANSKFYTAASWKELHWNYDAATIPTKDFDLKPMLNTTTITESNQAGGGHGTVTGVKIAKASQTTPVSLFPDKQYLYLIPVGDTDVVADNGTGCAEGDVQIGFHYDIVTKDKTNTGQYIASHAESVIKIPAGHLKRQKTYQYTLTINLHAIVIDEAKVTEWGNEVTASPVE